MVGCRGKRLYYLSLLASRFYNWSYAFCERRPRWIPVVVIVLIGVVGGFVLPLTVGVWGLLFSSFILAPLAFLFLQADSDFRRKQDDAHERLHKNLSKVQKLIKKGLDK